MARQRSPSILMVSDGRGQTGLQLVKACLVQFEGQRSRIIRRSHVRSADRVRKIVEKAAEDKAIIFFTLVGEETRRAMFEHSSRLLVPTVDLLGPTFTALHDLFQREPTATPGLLYASQREELDRYDAIDYTLRHDDGQRPHELDRADVVLVGVSRASKSTTCFYLAYEGIKAANVPLIPGIDPPHQLLELNPHKVIGLRVNVMRLRTVREVRADNLRLDPADDYVDKRAIAHEVNEAHRLMESRRWQSFDISYMAIEEIARNVMQLAELRDS
jgi:regulator of PEP synthase PpsR (kinase-PPPase family)